MARQYDEILSRSYDMVRNLSPISSTYSSMAHRRYESTWTDINDYMYNHRSFNSLKLYKRYCIEGQNRFCSDRVETGGEESHENTSYFAEENSPEIVRICVGGEKFITTRQTVNKFSDTKLRHLLANEANYNIELGMYFFDRSPEVFRAILDCHRYGEMHLPGHLCGYDLCQELEFWGISVDKVAKCCIHKITVGRSEAAVYANVEAELSDDFEDLLVATFRMSGWERTKLKIYLFLEHPMYSKQAARWGAIFALLIVASTFNVALMSHPMGRRKNDRNITVVDDDHGLINLVNTSKWRKLWETEVEAPLYYFDLSLVTIFTIELVVRLFSGPNKRHYFKSWINIVDLMTICMYWTKCFLSIITKFSHAHYSALESIDIAVFLFTELQFLRMFRILKLARNFNGLRVLLLVLKNSRHELVTLIVFIVVGMFFFSFIIYVVEIGQVGTFDNVPLAFWWSIITMSTVGYGDIYPTGFLGYIVGAMCAVFGMIIGGLSIPILSNNFNTYYNTLEYQISVQAKRIGALKAMEQEIRKQEETNPLRGVDILKTRNTDEDEGTPKHKTEGAENAKCDHADINGWTFQIPKSQSVLGTRNAFHVSFP